MWVIPCNRLCRLQSVPFQPPPSLALYILQSILPQLQLEQRALVFMEMGPPDRQWSLPPSSPASGTRFKLLNQSQQGLVFRDHTEAAHLGGFFIVMILVCLATLVTNRRRYV
jgi:hypothetical protein